MATTEYFDEDEFSDDGGILSFNERGATCEESNDSNDDDVNIQVRGFIRKGTRKRLC